MVTNLDVSVARKKLQRVFKKTDVCDIFAASAKNGSKIAVSRAYLKIVMNIMPEFSDDFKKKYGVYDVMRSIYEFFYEPTIFTKNEEQNLSNSIFLVKETLKKIEYDIDLNRAIESGTLNYIPYAIDFFSSLILALFYVKTGFEDDIRHAVYLLFRMQNEAEKHTLKSAAEQYLFEELKKSCVWFDNF